MSTLIPIADLTGPPGAGATDPEAIADLIESPGPVADAVDDRIDARQGQENSSGISTSPQVLGDLLVADSFMRPDGPIKGSAAITGQHYTTSGTTPQDIQDFAYAPAPASGDAAIAYVAGGGISSAWEMHVFFNSNADMDDNLVIGSGKGTGFGDPLHGSVQLGVNREQLYLFKVVDDGSGTEWIHGIDPITGLATEYQHVAALEFNQPLKNDGTRYPCKAFFYENGFCTIQTHDGQTQTIQDREITESLLGWFIGIQARSPQSHGFFGGIDYYAVYGVKQPEHVAGSLLRFERSDQWATVPMPANHVDTGLDLIWEGSLDDWTTDPAIQTIAYQSLGFTWSIRNDKPYLSFSYAADDSTGDAAAAQSAPAWTNGERMAHRVTRDPVTGTVTFYTSPPKAKGVAYTWSMLGATRPTNPGAINNPGLPVRLSDRQGSNRMIGNVAYFAMKDGIGGGDIVNPLDVRGPLVAGTWYFVNPSFVVPQDAVLGLSTRLAGLQASIDAAHPITQRMVINPMFPADASVNWNNINNSASCIGGGYRSTATSQGAPGSSISWDIWCDAATYAFSFFFRKAGTFGTVQVSLDGVDIGSVFDGYAASPLNDNAHEVAGVVVATAGKKRLTLTTVGKNALSNAYGAGVQVVGYRKTS